FGIIEGSRYGWWRPIGDALLGDSISIVPVALAVAVVVLAGFVRHELRRARAGEPVVFDFADLVHRGFRYGLINTLVLAMGEFGAFFVLPIFLQAGRHLSAVESGTWLLPAGGVAFLGGYLGGQLSRTYGPKYVITVGLTFEAAGIWIYALAFSSHTTFWQLLPGLVLHGIGIGFATSQLTNVVLSDIPPQKSGSASGAAGMVRQVGTALGIAVIGAIFIASATDNITTSVNSDQQIPAAARASISEGIGDRIGGGALPPGGDPRVGQRIGVIVSDGVAHAARPAISFAGIVVTLGALLSLLVPNIPPDSQRWAAAAQASENAPPN
ncbi:MAG: hypothetical protein V7636_332, partial [Actinomycetota bacterium]